MSEELSLPPTSSSSPILFLWWGGVEGWVEAGLFVFLLGARK